MFSQLPEGALDRLNINYELCKVVISYVMITSAEKQVLGSLAIFRQDALVLLEFNSFVTAIGLLAFPFSLCPTG